MLPTELLHVIAGNDMETYRSMLALPPFARSLNPGTVTDFMISFGFGIEITREYIKWTHDGVEHRNDGPAVVFPGGTRYWYQRGELHRVGGPAVEFRAGTQWWYQHGKFHRVGGPAEIHPDGTQRWYQHGKLHRDDGPAVIHSSGRQCWYQHGKLIRPKN
jgi:hypothetical protein